MNCPPVSLTSTRNSPVDKPDPFDAVSKIVDIPKGSDPWTVNPAIGGTLTCNNADGIFSIEGTSPSSGSVPLLNALIHVARWRDADLKFVDLSKLSPNADLLALPNRHPNIQGWMLPFDEQVQDSPDLNPGFFWLRFKDGLLGINVEQLPEDCSLRTFAQSSEQGPCQVVDTRALPFGDRPDLWINALFAPGKGGSKTFEEAVAQVRLLVYLGLNTCLPRYDGILETLMSPSNFSQFLEVVELVESLDKQFWPKTRTQLKDLANRFLSEALNSRQVPGWLQDFPLTSLFKLTGKVYAELLFPCTPHAIDLACSPENCNTVLPVNLLTSDAGLFYLVAKVRQHPTIRSVLIYEPYPKELWPIGYCHPYREEFRFLMELSFVGLEKKCMLTGYKLDLMLPLLEGLPRPLGICVDLTEGKNEENQLFPELGGAKMKGLIRPYNVEMSGLNPSDYLSRLVLFDSCQMRLNPQIDVVSDWRKALRSSPYANKIRLGLKWDLPGGPYMRLIEKEDLALPVKSIDLELSDMTLEFVKTHLTQEQGTKIRHLCLKGDFNIAPQLEGIPFRFMPNLKELSITVTPEMLPVLKQQLAHCPKIKRLHLGFTGALKDTDLQNLPPRIEFLRLRLQPDSELTAESLCSFVAGYPGYVQLWDLERVFPVQRDQDRIKKAVRAQLQFTPARP